MIKQYETPAAYAAEAAPNDESRVARIEQNNEIKVDGVNVVVPFPGDGDVVFEDADGKPRFVRWDTVKPALIDDTWTHIGYAFGVRGRRFKVLDKAFPSAAYKWLNCWQYTISAISASTIVFYLHMKGDYAAWVEIEVELTDDSDGYMNATTVSEINTALEAAGNTGNVGYENHGYWAYLNTDKIIVQCDFCADYRQYQINDSTHALVGCTMALSVWGDMPMQNSLFRKNGLSATSAIANLAKGIAYYSVNGKTPTADWPLTSADYVTKTAFETSAYCADLRAFYGTYDNYIAQNMTRYPHPEYGVFKMIDADEMTRRYAAATFTKKDNTTDVKFPALNTALSVGYGSGMFAQGKWHLSDVTDGVEYMNDATMAKLAAAQTAMGTTVIDNTVTRWFARRVNATSAWFYYATYGPLYIYNVPNALRCQAVALCEL
jgi:hypothetical protein